jgi:hypothetical protein
MITIATINTGKNKRLRRLSREASSTFFASKRRIMKTDAAMLKRKIVYTIIIIRECSFEGTTMKLGGLIHNGYNSQNGNRMLNRPNKTES